MEPQWRSRTLLGRLTPATRAELLTLGRPSPHPAGKTLIQEHETGRFALLLTKGYVRVTTQVDGVELLLTLRIPGDLVGDMAATSGQPRSATVTSCTPVEVIMIQPDMLTAFMRKHWRAAEAINALQQEQLLAANRRRVEFATLPLRPRLARVILELADLCGERGDDGTVRLPGWFPQSDIAALVGSARPTVQKALAELRRMDLIGTAYRSITIKDPDRLATMCERPDQDPVETQ